MSEPTPAPEKKKGKGGKAFIVLALLALVGGGATPWLLPSSGNTHDDEGHEKGHGAGHVHDAHGAAAKKKKAKPGESTEPKQAVLPFGDVAVRLNEERVNRFLRVKILIVIEEEHTKEITETLNKQKPYLKSWLLSHLSDQTVNDVSRAAGQNRLRREMRDEFNKKMFSDGSEKVIDVLMDEFLVQ